MSSGPQYPTHFPLNPLQRGAVTLFSIVGALARPARGDLVATVGETTALWALDRIRARMAADPVGARILAEKPVISDENVAHCWNLPEHTFGGSYAQFMGDRGFQADDRPPVRFINDPELAYVIQRMRQVHDFWHVLFGCHTDVFGEIALKAVEFVQTGVPMTGLAATMAQYRLNSSDRAVMATTYLPWAVRAGTKAKDLMCVYYEQHYQDDLEDLRRQLGILPAPMRKPRHENKQTS